MRVRGRWGELDVDGERARFVSGMRLWAEFLHVSDIARWTHKEREVVEELIRARDAYAIAKQRGVTVHAVRKRAARAAKKAGARGPLDLVGRILRRAALDEIRRNALMIAMLSPNGRFGFAHVDHANELVGMTAGRIELATVTVCAVDELTRAQARVLRQGIAGFKRGETAELLALRSCTVNNYAAMICEKHDTTRLIHVVLDVFRLACAVRLPRYTLSSGHLRGGVMTIATDASNAPPLRRLSR